MTAARTVRKHASNTRLAIVAEESVYQAAAWVTNGASRIAGNGTPQRNDHALAAEWPSSPVQFTRLNVYRDNG
jgi:hypothetical protein